MAKSDKPIEDVGGDIDRPQKDIPIETIISLRNKGLSLDQIAKITGCCKQNVHQRLESVGFGYSRERIGNFKESRADIFAFIQSKLLNSLDDAEIKKLNPYQRIIGTGILYDKERLERGQSTEIIDVTHTINSIEELSNREKILEAEYRLLKQRELNTSKEIKADKNK